MKIEFPKDFLWGAATSGSQTEGDKLKANKNIYDFWYEQSPDDFFDRVGPQTTINEFENYKNDVPLMKEIGLNSFRTSIQWSRLIKNFDSMEVDEKAVKFYRDYFKSIKDEEIKLFVNLFHFDMPIEIFHKFKGWEGRETIELYLQYARICFQLFGDLVDNWITFNEPSANSEGKYLEGWHYPFAKDFKRYITTAHYTMLAHAKVVTEFKKIFNKDSNKKIGIVLNLTPVYPKDNSSEQLDAAKKAELIYNRFYLDAALKGAYPSALITLLKESNIIFDFTSSDIAILKNAKIDFVGLNYYQPKRVQASLNKNANYPWRWFENYIWPERRINPYRGWEIHPKTIYEMALVMKEEYGNFPFYISENGMGVEDENRFKNEEGIIQDDYRIEFITEHLFWLQKAISEGVNCFGYHNWTFIDCWSWANAFKNRYGFISVNLKNQKRTIKKSGEWYKKLALSSELEVHDEMFKKITSEWSSNGK